MDSLIFMKDAMHYSKSNNTILYLSKTSSGAVTFLFVKIYYFLFI